MAEWLTRYKQTEMFQAAKKIQDKKDAISRMYARATWGKDLQARWTNQEAKKGLERAYFKAGHDYYQDLRVHPEKIYEEMKHCVERNLHGDGLKPNAWLMLEFLEGKHDAIQFVAAWEPVGKEYGNAILRSLIDEDLLKNGETLDQLKGRLRTAQAEEKQEMER